MFDLVVSSLLLIATSPLFLVVTLLVKLSGPGPVFFRSRRLGWAKTTFDMLKFRTLKVDAEKVLAGSMLTADRAAELDLEHRFGRFLRETRLDELPQLINVLKGDMGLIGPRPVRPEVYERFGTDISGYDRRFMMLPGLIGYSQLFTPHSTSKRLRSHVDNKYAAVRVRYLSDLRLLFVAGIASLSRAIWLIGRSLSDLVKRIRHGRFRGRRHRARIAPARVQVAMPGVEGAEQGSCSLVNMNDEAILFFSDFELPLETLLELKLRIESRQCGRRKGRIRTAHCHGRVFRNWTRDEAGLPFAAVVKYTPDTPLNAYRIAKYFLHEGLV